MELLNLEWDGITAWKITKWSITALMLYYVCTQVIFKKKIVLTPQQRAKRRYIVAHSELLRRLTTEDRRELQVTLRNTAANVKVGVRNSISECNSQNLKRNGNSRKSVVISQEKNTYYEPEKIAEELTMELVEMIIGEHPSRKENQDTVPITEAAPSLVKQEKQDHTISGEQTTPRPEEQTTTASPISS